MPPDPAPQPDPDSVEAQRDLLSKIVGDLPAFKEGFDTGQGILAPEGQEADAFYGSFTPKPPQPAASAPAPSNGQPVSVQTQTPPAPQPQPAAPQAAPQTIPSGRLLAGKYRSVEEMERGYNEAQKELRARNEENLVLKAAQLAAEKVGGFRQPREEPAPPSTIPVQFQGDQPVVPTDLLLQQVREMARSAAQETISGILTPMQQLGNANANLRTSYPEFAASEAQFANWLRDNPRYQDLIQQSPDVGLESAYLKFSRDTGTQQVEQATQTTLAAQHQVDQARSQAAPAGNTAPASRRPTEQEGKWVELKRLYDEWQTTGDARSKKRFLDARTAFALGDQFINTLDRTQWGR